MNESFFVIYWRNWAVLAEAVVTFPELLASVAIFLKGARKSYFTHSYTKNDSQAPRAILFFFFWLAVKTGCKQSFSEHEFGKKTVSPRLRRTGSAKIFSLIDVELIIQFFYTITLSTPFSHRVTSENYHFALFVKATLVFVFWVYFPSSAAQIIELYCFFRELQQICIRTTIRKKKAESVVSKIFIFDFEF